MTPGTPRRSSWFILLVVMLASMSGPVNQYKAPPILRLLMDAFALPLSKAGLLMSVFSLAGLILALPGGVIFERLGYRTAGLIAIASLAFGATMGSISPNAATILTSRFIEGIGNSLISMVAPAVIAIWFTVGARGKAMGVWSAFVPLGSIMMFSVAPFIASHWNWRGVWWFGSLYAIGAGLLFYFFIAPTPPQPSDGEASLKRQIHTKGGLRGVLRNRNLWLISCLWGCFSFVFTSFLTWAATYLHDVHRISLGTAGFIMSTMALIGIAGCPVAGWILDIKGSRKPVCVIPMMALLVIWPLAPLAGKEVFILLAFTIGLTGGFTPAGVFSATSEVVKDHRLRGMAMGVIQIGQNVGLLIGPVVFGSIIQFWGGWQVAYWGLVPVTALGIVAGLLAKID